jgi:AraC-like DNA-binding protein
VSTVTEVIDEHVQRAPAEALRPHIAWYAGYRQRGVPPAVHRGLPSPFLTLIFTLDEPMMMAAHPDRRQPAGSFGTLLGGLHAAPVLITHAGAQSGIQVALRPLGLRALLGLPAGELAWVEVPAPDVLGAAGLRIHERVRAAGSWHARFAVLDAELGRLLSDEVPAVAPEVSRAWRLLLRSGGRVPVAELAAETGWSSRHLASRFRAEIGLAPKEAGRVIRFHRASRLLRPGHGPGYRLADLAAACGYFDQAHLAREFRALAGCPPSQWLAEEFRNVQAAGRLADEDG